MDPEMIKAVQDVGLTLTAGLATKPLLEKMLGPSFEYVGRALEGLLERYGNKNVENIVRRAIKLLGSKAERPGSVDPRVMRAVIEDGSFVADLLAQTYFAGVLASSRTEDGADDRGLLFLSTLKSLPNAQIALHYHYYSWLRKAFAGGPFRLNDQFEHGSFQMFVPMVSLGIDTVSVADAIIGLAQTGLIRDSYNLALSVNVPGYGPTTGVVVGPSHFGVRLYLWVHGFPNGVVDDLLQPANYFRDEDAPPLPDGVVRIGIHGMRWQLSHNARSDRESLFKQGPYDAERIRETIHRIRLYLWPDAELPPIPDVPASAGKLSYTDMTAIADWLANAEAFLVRDNVEVLTAEAQRSA